MIHTTAFATTLPLVLLLATTSAIMADFTGMMVSVTLKNPENLVLEGKVLQIIPGQTLALSNGMNTP